MYTACLISAWLVFGVIVAGNGNIAVVQDPAGSRGAPPVKRNVQISLDVDAGVLIENWEGKRLGVDFKTGKALDEIAGARVITHETSSTFVLPFDKSGKFYQLSIDVKSECTANLSMTGPGFVTGFHNLSLRPREIQKLGLASNGAALTFTSSRAGSGPQIFLTAQSARDQPSYRFEVTAASLDTGKTVSVSTDMIAGRLLFNADDTNKVQFSVMMRRTNPGGIRGTYQHHDISFARTNRYAMKFNSWDGKGELCFYDLCDGCEKEPCTKLKNESLK